MSAPTQTTQKSLPNPSTDECGPKTNPHESDSERQTMRLTATERVYVEIKDAILKGEYKPGQQLRQDALASNFGVSRIPIREALMQLSRENLVVFSPFKGAEVASLSIQELRETFEVCFILEAAAMRYSIDVITDEQINKIERAIRGSDTAEPSLLAVDGSTKWDFHQALYAVSGRSKLVALIDAQHVAAERYTRLYLHLMHDKGDSTKDHLAILQCCRLRNSAEAILILHEHLRKACQRLCEYIYPQYTAADTDGSYRAPLFPPM